MSCEIDKKFAVKAIVFDKKRKKFLLIKRNEKEEIYKNLWDIPGGKVEIGETLWEGLVREIFEETGIKIDEKILILPIKGWIIKEKCRVGITFLVVLENIKKIRLGGEHKEYMFLSENEIEKINTHPGIKEDFILGLRLLRKMGLM